MGGFSGVRFDAESSALVLFGLGYVGPDFGVSFRTGEALPGGGGGGVPVPLFS